MHTAMEHEHAAKKGQEVASEEAQVPLGTLSRVRAEARGRRRTRASHLQTYSITLTTILVLH
jgi:hypothetical protein